MTDIPTLSFCITCKNRFHQIRQTLRKNLDDNGSHSAYIDFVLVDFDSTDGLHEWVIDEFSTELASGYLKYYRTEELPLWHASVAKNTAHLCASGKILVNLDCDNFTGACGGVYLINTFIRKGNQIVTHQFNGRHGYGTFGRIAMLSEYFYLLCGYNESFDPMGFQDSDLIDRSVKMGLQYVLLNDDRYNLAIPNSKKESIALTGSTKFFMEMLEHNQTISFLNLSEGRLIANSGRFGIRKNLFDHNGKEFFPKIIKYGKTSIQ